MCIPRNKRLKNYIEPISGGWGIQYVTVGMICDPFTKWDARLGSQTWAFARRLAKGIRVQELLQSHGGGAALPEDSNQLHGWLETPCAGLELGKGSIKGEVSISITMRDCQRVFFEVARAGPRMNEAPRLDFWARGCCFQCSVKTKGFAGPWRQGRLLAQFDYCSQLPVLKTCPFVRLFLFSSPRTHRSLSHKKTGPKVDTLISLRYMTWHDMTLHRIHPYTHMLAYKKVTLAHWQKIPYVCAIG